MAATLRKPFSESGMIIVAGVDAPDVSKAAANYVCDGTDDEEEI